MLQAIVATSAAVAFPAVGTSVVCVGHWVLSCVCSLIATDMCTKTKVGAKGSHNMLATALLMRDAILLILAKRTQKTHTILTVIGISISGVSAHCTLDTREVHELLVRTCKLPCTNVSTFSSNGSVMQVSRRGGCMQRCFFETPQTRPPSRRNA